MLNSIKKLINKLKRFANKSIRNKIIIFFVPLTILVVVSIGTISFNRYYTTIEKQIINDTTRIIEQMSINIDFYFSDIKTPMAMMARNPNIIDALKNYEFMNSAERLIIERNIHDFTSNINSLKSYIGDLIIIGKNDFAMNLKKSSRILYNYNFLEAPWLRKAIEKGHDGIRYISVHKCDYYPKLEIPYEMIVSAILPVEDNGRVIGYILGDINLKKLNRLFNTLNLGDGGIVYMVDQDGIINFHPQEELVGSRMDGGIAQEVLAKEKGNFVYKNDISSKLIVFSRSDVTGWFLVAEIPYDAIFNPIFEIKNAILWIIGLSILFVIIFSLIIARQISKPLNTLIMRMEKVIQHDFYPYENDYGYGEVAVLGKKFENMVSEINKLINEIYISKVRQREAEFEALRSQINPHFLHNALQLIKAEAVMNDNYEISRIITSLGYLLRYSIDNKRDMVTIDEEIDYIRYYMDIYKRRFGEKFDFIIKVDENIRDYLMPKLILQPIVENSIKHGFKDIKSGGIINIAVNEQEESIFFHIIDNGQGITKERLERILSSFEEGKELNVGLYNVNYRLVLKFGSQSRLNISSEYGKYTHVSFEIPKIQ